MITVKEPMPFPSPRAKVEAGERGPRNTEGVSGPQAEFLTSAACGLIIRYPDWSGKVQPEGRV